MKTHSSYRIIEGRNPAVEAIKAGTEIRSILIEERIGRDAKIDLIIRSARDRRIPVKKVPRHILERLSQTGVHQGVIVQAGGLPVHSLASVLKACEQKGKEPFIVILTEVLYQYNLGALLRTALAAGVDAVIVPKHTRDPGPVTARAAMGALEYMPLIYENIFVAMKDLHEYGIKIVAAYEQGDRKYYDADLKLPLAVLVGGEDKGISETVLKRVDEPIRIPMDKRVPSLNISVAAGVVLFEVKRQNDR